MTTKNGRKLILWKSVVSDTIKLKFVKEKKATGFLSNLGIKTPWNKTRLLGPLLF